MTRPARALLLFLDGVGIGPADERSNPFLRARLPTLAALSGGRVPTLDERVAGPDAFSDPRADRPTKTARDPMAPNSVGRWFPLDATLDTPGTPQSGTGQAALLAGLDAAALFGGHFGPWVPVRLRPLLEEGSVLRSVADAGGSVAFANAYPRTWPGPRGGRRIAGPPLAARGAGVLDRHELELATGEAVASEIVNDAWRDRLGFRFVPEIRAEDAGRNLAAIASRHDLTLYAHYATDAAGHTGEMDAAVDALERVDAFLAGLLSSLPPDALLLVTSDHGNIEDIRGGHTRNPVLGLAAGPGTDEAARLRDLRGVAPFLRGVLGA